MGYPPVQCERRHRGILPHLHSMPAQPTTQLLAIQTAEGHGRELDDETVAMTNKTVAEYLARVLQPEPIHRLVKGTREDHAPEAVDRSPILPVTRQPVEEWRI